jgi:IS5 family transposase
VLPKKGKLSKERKEIESSEEFKKCRRQHSAVESAINALEVHGLDRCPDNGLVAFKSYTSLAIVSRNLQRLGALVQKKARKVFARTQ